LIAVVVAAVVGAVVCTVVAGAVVATVVVVTVGISNLKPDCEYTTKAASANKTKSKKTLFFFIVIN
jgi:hypothetical protein